MGKLMNDGIPPETILKYKIRECGELKAEIDHLKYEVEWRDKAIREFKKWQKKVAEYNYEYWLGEGLKLLDEQPDERKANALITLIHKYNVVKVKMQGLPKSLRKLVAARDELIKVLKELDEM